MDSILKKYGESGNLPLLKPDSITDIQQAIVFLAKELARLDKKFDTLERELVRIEE